MQNLETGKDKIKKICDVLMSETLEPAKEQAQQILLEAEKKAQSILQEAKKKAHEIVEEGYSRVESHKNVVEGALRHASEQAQQTLKQKIEQALFSPSLAAWLGETTEDPKLAGKLVEALVHALDKEGTQADFTLYLGEKLSKEKVLAAVGAQLKKRLSAGEIELKPDLKGVQIKLEEQNMVLDLSNSSLQELMAQFVRKDFRHLLFQST